MLKRFWRLATALLFGFLLVAPALAAGTLDVAGKFRSGEAELDVATYTEAPRKVALLGIDSQGRISFAFNKAEWSALIALWRRAETVKSSTWKTVGDMTETKTQDVSHLRIDAGPATRFTIWSAKVGSKTCTLQPADYRRFAEALEQVRKSLAAQ